MTDPKSIVKEIKKDFFSFRNGIVAEALKKLYRPGCMIYGLNVAQFIELSKKYPKNLELGMELWNDKTSRETRLFALYIIPADVLPKDAARKMIFDIGSIEEAEFLAFKILRFLPFRKELLQDVKADQVTDIYISHCIDMFEKNLQF